MGGNFNGSAMSRKIFRRPWARHTIEAGAGARDPPPDEDDEGNPAEGPEERWDGGHWKDGLWVGGGERGGWGSIIPLANSFNRIVSLFGEERKMCSPSFRITTTFFRVL